MADPGNEWPETHRYRIAVMNPWLREHGMPEVTLIDRKSEGAFRERAWRLETLQEECMRIHALPSVAYGFKKCSLKYKAEPSRWWLARQDWAQAEWAVGRKIVKVIGYDYDEGHRVRAAFQDRWEDARLTPLYPLVEKKLTRAGAEQVILKAGLPLPKKSACMDCPNNQLAEWEKLRDEQPEAFARAVALSRNAASDITEPSVVGLMRCNPRGQRQLHIWADGGYPKQADFAFADDEGEAMPCECAL